MTDDLALALRLGEIAAEVALSYYGRYVRSEIKPDGSPVGEADLAIEKALLEVLGAERPDDAVLSEEAGHVGRGERRWLLDPLDGTSMFLDGDSGWGTHIALQDAEERSIVGVVTRPLEGKWWWAVRGEGSYAGDLGSLEGRRIHVSDVSSIEEARLSAWQSWHRRDVRKVREMPGWVHPDANVFLRVAEGEIDCVASLGGMAWDHAPLVLLVEEAGGRYRDRMGGSRIDLKGGVYSNAHLDGPMGELLGWY
ncbi:MAG: inositol monophosphatase family protein [Actinomycetota bacterium]